MLVTEFYNCSDVLPDVVGPAENSSAKAARTARPRAWQRLASDVHCMYYVIVLRD